MPTKKRRIRITADGCWLWLSGKNASGYGQVRVGGNMRYAHRVSYEGLRGPIPAGMCLDHLCRVRHCVNPDHLEPVSNRTNILRGEGATAHHARKTHCVRGHPLAGDNLYYWPHRSNTRHCKACKLIRGRVAWVRNHAVS